MGRTRLGGLASAAQQSSPSPPPQPPSPPLVRGGGGPRRPPKNRYPLRPLLPLPPFLPALRPTLASPASLQRVGRPAWQIRAPCARIWPLPPWIYMRWGWESVGQGVTAWPGRAAMARQARGWPPPSTYSVIGGCPLWPAAWSRPAWWAELGRARAASWTRRAADLAGPSCVWLDLDTSSSAGGASLHALGSGCGWCSCGRLWPGPERQGTEGPAPALSC